MQTTFLWTGREYYSMENCVVTTGASEIDINSMIVGQYQGKIYRVEYNIKTTPAWETEFCELKFQQNGVKRHYRLEKRGRKWSLNEQWHGQFDNCIDVDIPLTPLTNSLPINRLRLPLKAEQEIKVIYIDLLEEQIVPVRQKYSRSSHQAYHYENVPNDFEAEIVVDEAGFVVDYPELFVRTASYSV